MTDYHTTYKGPEGQTTQWEDIQTKLGNMAPKPKKEPPPKYEGEMKIIKDATWMAGQDEVELAGLEDDFADNRMLESIRQRRLKEMQDAANTPLYGQLESIRSSDFRQAVTDANAALVLNEVGPICRSAEEDMETAMDRDAQRLVKRVILQREREDEDSDFE